MLYTYYCKCGKEKEVSHSIKEDPEVKCDKCGTIMKRKILMSAGGVHFKGTGFSKRNI